jgi:membrane associated rhomboid family serine protease
MEFIMDELEHSLAHWVIVIVFLIALGVPIARIIGRTGHNRLWTILFFIPLLNVIGLWVFAYSQWPAVDKSSK